jgi:hypothetical protein
VPPPPVAVLTQPACRGLVQEGAPEGDGSGKGGSGVDEEKEEEEMVLEAVTEDPSAPKRNWRCRLTVDELRNAAKGWRDEWPHWLHTLDDVTSLEPECGGMCTVVITHLPSNTPFRLGNPIAACVRSICDAVLALEAERTASGAATGAAPGPAPPAVLFADVQPRGIPIGDNVLLYTLYMKKEGGGYLWLVEEAADQGTSDAALRTVSCLPHIAGRMMMSDVDRPEPQLLALPVKPADCVTTGEALGIMSEQNILWRVRSAPRLSPVHLPFDARTPLADWRQVLV